MVLKQGAGSWDKRMLLLLLPGHTHRICRYSPQIMPLRHEAIELWSLASANEIE